LTHFTAALGLISKSSAASRRETPPSTRAITRFPIYASGSAQHLYENVYCQRGQMENLIKLHKAQLASDRMSCHSATANQVRLVLHTAAFWLMHGVRAAIPKTNPLKHVSV
jgi:hypothetical protein